MTYTLKELLDVPRLRVLLDSLDEIHKLPSAIVDMNGTILTATGWQDLCTKFHRINPETAKKCLESDLHFAARLDAEDPHVIYRCPMGLVDAAIPLIIEGQHLGNVFTGQLLTAPPDEAYFIQQAREYGFDEIDYLAAVRKVPLFSEEKLRKNLTFIHTLTQVLTEQGLLYKRKSESEEALRVQNNEFVASQKLLKESEERFRALHDATFGGVFIHEKGVILDCNQGLSNMTGFTSDELIGMDGFKLVTQNSLGRVQRNIEQGYDLRYEVEGVRKDGSVYPLSIRGKTIPYKGREARVIEFRDITARKKAEDELRTERFRLSEVIRGADIGTWEWHLQTGEIILNERYAEMIGYRRDEFSPFTIDLLRELVHPDDLPGSLPLLEKHFNGELDFYEYEFRIKCKDGRWLWVISRGKVSSWTDDGNPLLMFGTHTDIDQRKRHEEERKTIEKLNTVGTLAGGIAHDFNNILAGLYGNISLAKIKLVKDHPAFRFLDAAEKSMRRATLLTNQLLTFAKGGAPVVESVNLGELIEEVVQFNLSGSNVKPVISLAENLWLAQADLGQLQQVFGNLTINAAQAMPEGGYLWIEVENTEVAESNIQSLAQGRYIRIRVKDNGTGIAPEHLNRIFDPYFTTKQTGSGLGLATIYSIIHQHGGHVSVDSRLGKGTTFTLYLPASELTELPQKEPKVVLEAPEHTARILVMDDEEMIRTSISAMLEELNFTVETAVEGQQALDTYQHAMTVGTPFDLVILDLTIPGGLGGKDTAAKLLQIDPAVQMVVSSGYADDPIMANFSAYGFKGVLVKPYHLDKLSEVISQALRS
ncbi:PocR ligand-binding domain-containing protein [Geopsychrobacter electrodiphilus]|uniref:PocR ligand-binding domain-containing protein n=1 Tax=Geopsychrobacter electrodiphilus TaxID=225196 RepID=UPI00037629D0|nr:PocR ligand-binding domain-containing protein [Geopsychrobacter electrodiphilus]